MIINRQARKIVLPPLTVVTQSLQMLFKEQEYRHVFVDKALSAFSGFTANSTRTYFDENGVLQTAAPNVPRITYDPIAGACLGYLAEPSATNLWTYSQDHSNAAWAKTDTTVGTPLSVRGMILDVLTQGAAGTASVSRAAATTTAGGLNSASKIVSRGNHDWLRMSFGDTLGNSVSTWFNYTTGLFGTLTQSGTPSSITRKATPLGGGLFLVEFSANLAGTQVNFTTYGTTADNVTTRVSGGIRYEGEAQLETGSVATSRIRTVASQVTRAADVLSVSSSNFTSFYNPTEGSIYCEFVMPAGVTSAYTAALSDGTSDNRLFVSASSSGVLTLSKTVATTQTQSFTSAIYPVGSVVKILLRYSASGINLSINGVANVVTLTAGLGLLNQLNIGNRVSSTTQQLNSTIADLRYFSRALPAEEAVYVTTYGVPSL